MKSFLFAALLCTPCYASSGFQVDLYVFSSNGGHGLSNETYIAEFRLPAQDEQDCNRIGNLGLKYFESGTLPDNSVTLAGFSCETIP